MMKKAFLFFMSLVLLLTFGGSVVAAAPQTKTPTVYIDGKKLNFADQAPVVQNGRTLVPMRAIFEALGAEVEWDQATQTVTAFKPDETYAGFIGDKTITLFIGTPTAHILSEPRERPETGVDKMVTLDVPAQVMNGRTMVPLRFVSEALDAHVKWDPNQYRIDIYTPEIKEYWYQLNPFNNEVTERYDLWTYEEPENLDFFLNQVYLRTIKYGDENVHHFYAFMVQRMDASEYGRGIERHELEAKGTVNDKYWYISFDLYRLDEETRELKNWQSGKTQMEVHYKNGQPEYDWIPFSIAVSYFILQE